MRGIISWRLTQLCVLAFWVDVNAAHGEQGALCRDAGSWGVSPVKSAGGNNNRKRGGSDAEYAYMTVMPRFLFIGTLFLVSVASHRVCSGIKSGGRQRRKSGRMWQSSTVLLVRSLRLALWESWTNNGTNATTSSVSLSGLSDQLNHQQSGMWVNSGTVGR